MDYLNVLLCGAPILQSIFEILLKQIILYRFSRKKSYPKFIDFTIFSDNKLSDVQDCLSITEDYNEPVTYVEDRITEDQPVIKEKYRYVNKQLINEDHFNNDESENSTLLGLLMGIDNTYNPIVKEINNYLIYEKAQDFQFTITRKDALDKLFVSVTNDQKLNYCWKQWQKSNYYLVELLNESELPPQISVSIQKTYESNKILTKYCYCGGCNNKNERTTFKIIVNKLDLINSKELININVIFTIDKKQCRHLKGKTYGQCRGLARQYLLESDYKLPRDMRKKILSTVKNEVRYTGNRQNVPSANSAKTISSSKNTNKQLGYNLCECLHAAILI